MPETSAALTNAIRESHRRYTRHINFREKWRGYLWQGRFASFPMDQPHLLAAARYVELNPVRARIVEHPQDYPWSSAQAHLSGKDDLLVKAAPLLKLVSHWSELLESSLPDDTLEQIRQHERTGRPLGDLTFLEALENRLGRLLKPQKRGPKPKLE